MIKILAVIFVSILVFGACDTSGGSGDFLRDISGSVSYTTNVRIGTFSSDYWFLSGFGDEDEVGEEFDAGTAGEFSPLNSVLPETDGSYTILLPEDVETMGELIAWVDSDGDGLFDLGPEDGYFPQKNIDSTVYVIKGFGYIVMGDTSVYLVSYGGGNNDDLSLVGNTGFNFTID